MLAVSILRIGSRHRLPPRHGFRTLRRQEVQIRFPQQRLGGCWPSRSGLTTEDSRTPGQPRERGSLDEATGLLRQVETNQ